MDGKQELTCYECKEEWDFPDICYKTQMSMDEMLFWGIKINLNNLSGVCPKCTTYCENVSEQNALRMKCSRKGCSFEFCWKCKVTWTYNHECYSRKEFRDILKNCPRKTLQYSEIKNVPSIRLCPNCKELIEHTDGCKEMSCIGCKKSFCFVCLEMCSGGKLSCTAYNQKCTIAPVQTI